MPSVSRAAVLRGALSLVLESALPLSAAFADQKKERMETALYVSPQGNDTWSGTLAEPNGKRTDGPFATVARAQQAVRTITGRTAAARAAVTVYLRGGEYFLPSPLAFDAADSGTDSAPVVWAAYAGETPVLSGGTRLTGWKQTAPGRWETTLPEVAAGKAYFSQLYVNDARRLRPRFPKKGYHTIAGVLEASPSAAGKGFDGFVYREKDLDAAWQNRSDIEILPFHSWTMSRFHISAIDETAHTVSFAGRTRAAKDPYGLQRGNRFLVENVKEALSEPGEWYLDRPTGVLTYLSLNGENPNVDTVVAPRLLDLASMNDVAHVTFRGITFAHSGWNSAPAGISLGQAEIGIPPTIRLAGCRDCVFHDCTIRNIGGYAIQLGEGTKHCVLEDCSFIDLGAGGVMLGEQTMAPDDAHRASDNAIQNCLIAAGGRIHPSGVGVWIGQSPNNKVIGNEIVDFYYSGISAGWTWGYKENDCHHNTIAYNHIHQIGQGVLSDLGGIYTLGIMTGTVLDHNWIHDVVSYDYGGYGIYFDEGTSDILATNNIVYDMKSAPFMQHYGKDNVARNNIFAFGEGSQMVRYKVEDHLSFTLEQNIFYWSGKSLMGSPWDTHWEGGNYALKKNLYYNANPLIPVTFLEGANLTEWQAKGLDAGSIVADPMFADPKGRNFTLKPGSPSEQIGFVPIDIRSAGRAYDSIAPRTYPEGTSATFEGDFDDFAVGEKPYANNLNVTEEEKVPQANVRVTKETSASGRKSLKFVDAAGQKNARDPHIFYKPRLLFGTAIASFDMRREEGALFANEWRDAEAPFHIGPVLRVGADGLLTANDKPLGVTIPVGVWTHFEVRCTLGSGTYDLTVQARHQPAQKFKGLAYESGAGFQTLRWWAFSAAGDGPGVFYLDNVSLQAG